MKIFALYFHSFNRTQSIETDKLQQFLLTGFCFLIFQARPEMSPDRIRLVCFRRV